MSYEPTTILDRMTVKAGAVLFTVSVKLTSMNLSATSPRKTVVNLETQTKNRMRNFPESESGHQI